jgi:hypothetical protein
MDKVAANPGLMHPRPGSLCQVVSLTTVLGLPTLVAAMKSVGPIKHLIWAFLLALVCYALFYHGIEHRRVRKGPWEVTFALDETGMPRVGIVQPKLAITNVQISFPGQSASTTNGLGTVAFDKPKPVPYDVPFGRCVFMDTTFLPGTVTFQLFGHEIELLPRVLIIDHQERPWVSGQPITLHPIENSPAQPRR